MPNVVRSTITKAVRAGLRGRSISDDIRTALTDGDRALKTEALRFDSLAWMEFCIAIEVESGHGLTPADVGQMRHVYEIEEWLLARS